MKAQAQAHPETAAPERLQMSCHWNAARILHLQEAKSTARVQAPVGTVLQLLHTCSQNNKTQQSLRCPQDLASANDILLFCRHCQKAQCEIPGQPSCQSACREQVIL